MRELLYPLIVSSLHGLAWTGNHLLAVDPRTGYLLKIDVENEQTAISNGPAVDQWLDITGLSLQSGELWALREDRILRTDPKNHALETAIDLDYLAEGLALSDTEIFVSCRRSQFIFVYDRTTGERKRILDAPGIGEENLTFDAGALWVCDSVEQTVYCLDPETGKVRFSILTPYAKPTGLVFAGTWLYVAYSQEEDYIEEDPNRYNRLSIETRGKTFLHRLKFTTKPEVPYTLSNGYLIEMTYCEETAGRESVALENVEWRIALPADTPRQKLMEVEAIGTPFREEIVEGQRVAVFSFDALAEGEIQVFGWRAVIEVHGIKYQIDPDDLDLTLEIPEAIKAQYLIDDDDLAMNTRRVREATYDAVGDLTNPLEQMLAIREFVYDKLDYQVVNSISSPDSVLLRGKGSCGEYVGVMLALARLSGIPCRTVGRYKCPERLDSFGTPLEPRYNHVWIEFYLAGYGWVPCESSADDPGQRPYSQRFFLGLPWGHVEVGKGINFEETNVRGYSLSDLSINHVRFKILKELPAEESSGASGLVM
jgi:transglutaminase-like putative cysteine protease